eukprot:jgi/Tetstr1/434359/TSEL_023463.t1
MSSGSVHTVPPHEEYPPNSAQEDERAAPKAPSHDAMCGSDGPQKEERTDLSPLPETKPLQGASLVPKDVQERRSLIKQMMAKSTARIRCSVMTSDRKLLVTGSNALNDSRARVWRAQDMSLLHSLVGHSNNVLVAALSASEETLFTGSYDGLIKEWDLLTGDFIRDLRGHRSGIRGLVASPDGKVLYSCAADNSVRHWDLASGLCRRSFQGRHEDSTWPVCIGMSADGQFVATGSNGMLSKSTIKVFHATGSTHRDAGKCLATISHFGDSTGSVSALAFSPDSKLLISAGTDGSVAAWRLSWRSRRLGDSKLKTGFL